MSRSRHARRLDPRDAAMHSTQHAGDGFAADLTWPGTSRDLVPEPDIASEPDGPTQTFLGEAASVFRTGRTLRGLENFFGSLRSLLARLAGVASPVSRGMRRLQGRGRRLQVTETVQLGEKRFVAILCVDGEQFLVGGSATGVSLLATLAPSPETPAMEPVQVVRPEENTAYLQPAAEKDAPASFSAVLAAQSRRGWTA